MAQKVNSGKFVEFLQNCIDTGCGYIMGSKGQDPKKWATNSWWLRSTRGAAREGALVARACAQGVRLQRSHGGVLRKLYRHRYQL